MEEFENKDLYEESSLTKEEILERSRAENKKNGDEREKSNNYRAAIFALIVMLVFIIATSITEVVFSKQYVYSYSLIAMCWGISGSIWLARGILNRKYFQVILGILNFILCAFSYYLFIVNLLKVVG